MSDRSSSYELTRICTLLWLPRYRSRIPSPVRLLCRSNSPQQTIAISPTITAGRWSHIPYAGYNPVYSSKDWNVNVSKTERYRSPDGLLLCALGLLSSLLRFVFVASPESHAVARTPYTAFAPLLLCSLLCKSSAPKPSGRRSDYLKALMGWTGLPRLLGSMWRFKRTVSPPSGSPPMYNSRATLCLPIRSSLFPVEIRIYSKSRSNCVYILKSCRLPTSGSR
jgi:hypothetical protein